MDRIPLLDLSSQHRPLEVELHAAAARVLTSGRFILADEVAALERELASALPVRHAVGVSSGSDALLALLAAAGVGGGDEVVTTPYSFFATAEAIVRLGARPVFADIDPETLNIDPASVAAKIRSSTKAVLVVHLFGRTARMAEIAASCSRAGIPVVEDAAQAILASGGEASQRATLGSHSLGAALSFFPSKNLGGVGDGGMIVTNHDQVAARVRLLRSHGAVEKFRHVMIGGNFRLDELQAALLRVKLPHLARWTNERRRLAGQYLEVLRDLPLRLPPWEEGCVWNQFVVRVAADRRSGLIAHLEGRGIATAVYYPLPLHLQPALAQLGYQRGDLPVAEQVSAEALALPVYPGLSEASLTRIAGAIADFFR